MPKIFFHTHRLTTCGLKKLASGVFLERWKVLAEQWRRRRQKRTKNNKSPGYPGWLNDDPCRSLTHYAPLKGDHARRWVDISVLSTVNGYLVTFTKLATWNIYFFQSLVCCVVLLHFGLTHCGLVTPYSSVPNYCQSVSPKQTTLEEDWELFKKFSSILCLWFEIQGSRTDNFFDEFWTLHIVTEIWVNIASGNE